LLLARPPRPTLFPYTTLFRSVITAPFRAGQPESTRISAALTSLGPSYIKLGQFLATRADVIGPQLAGELSDLQDKLPPFSMQERSEEHTSELQSRENLVCRLL